MNETRINKISFFQASTVAQTAGESRSRGIQYRVRRVKYTFPDLFLFSGGVAEVIALVEVLLDRGV